MNATDYHPKLAEVPIVVVPDGDWRLNLPTGPSAPRWYVAASRWPVLRAALLRPTDGTTTP